MNSATRKSRVTAVVLAGGEGARLGGQDKGLLRVVSRPLVAHVLQRIVPQVNTVVISANRHLDQYGQFEFPVVADRMNDHQGPLAGIAASLPHVHTEYLLTVPCDTPLLPADLVDRLWNAMEDEEADMAVAHDGEQLQHLVALIRRAVAGSVDEFLEEGGRAVKEWAAKMFPAVAWFADQPLAFRNVNNDADLHDIEPLLKPGRPHGLSPPAE